MPRPYSGVTTARRTLDPDAPRVYGHSPFVVGVPLPGVLYLDDLALILSLGRTRAYELQATNELKQFELRPRIGNVARYSGKTVQAWLDGDDQTEAPRFFASARREGAR
jgi:hypothetical protein